MGMRRHRSHFLSHSHVGSVAPMLSAVAAALLAGCSADIRRLEQPTYAIGEKPPLPSEPMGNGRRNAGALPVVDNPGWPNSGPLNSVPSEPGAVRQSPDRVTALPEPLPTQPAVNSSVPFDAPKKARPATPAAAPASRATVPVAAGATIDVQPGDTLYGLSKRHGVSIAALMELNQLKSPNLHPGQKIMLPANARRPLAKAAVPTAPATPVAQGPAPVSTAAPQQAPAPIAATDWDGSYVVKAGDSLYGIARAHKVNAAELQRINGIADPAKMRPGMALKVPSGASANSWAAPVLLVFPRTSSVGVGTTTCVCQSPLSLRLHRCRGLLPQRLSWLQATTVRPAGSTPSPLTRTSGPQPSRATGATLS